MIFNKEETKNLLGMLKSEDTENHVVAFEALKNVDLKEYTGELLVLLKYGSASMSEWKDLCPEIYKTFESLGMDDKKLTGPKTLSLMTANKASKASVELFMESFVVDMVSFLDQVGYPTDKFEINIKIKD
jgi:hypothetical protein